MYVGEKRNPITLVLLSIVTCSIYFVYWMYVSSKEINEVLGEERLNPVLMLVLSLVCAPIALYYRDKALQEVGQKEGLPFESKFVMWIILCFVCSIGYYVSTYQTQEYLNQLWDKRQGLAPQA